VKPPNTGGLNPCPREAFGLKANWNRRIKEEIPVKTMPKLKAIGLELENLNARDYVIQAQAAERMGFNSFWVPEDYAFPGAFSCCVAVAAATSKIKIGTGVINPFTRHPVLIAMELAALDQISGGRAILGLGASIKLWIEEQMGIRYDKPLSALRDAFAIIRGLFAGEQLEYRGRVFTAGAGVRFNLQPLRADVPIYLGATSPKTLELAGEVADGWLPFGFGPEAVGRAIERIRIGAKGADRSLSEFDFCSLIFTAVRGDDRAARESIKPWLATFLGWFANQPELPLFTDFGLTPKDVGVIRESYARGELRTDMVSEAMVDGLAIAGSPQRCRDRLAQIIEAGITTAVFAPVFPAASGPDFTKNLEWLHQNLIRDFI
jgi:5,10-methylenetetrahydromethanopterin reductase